ncbi:hypothetical protein PMAYCL1PPCAC_31999, partial [Pristionchus mayeri]
GCFEDADCAAGTTDGRCAGGDMATLVMGCCGELTTTTHTRRTSLHSAASPCADKVNPMTGTSGCAKNAHLCDVAAYKAVMSDQCPRTCGRCGGRKIGDNSPANCVDKIKPLTGKHDCQERRSYCNSTAYASIMRVQCPATCGFC